MNGFRAFSCPRSTFSQVNTLTVHNSNFNQRIAAKVQRILACIFHFCLCAFAFQFEELNTKKAYESQSMAGNYKHEARASGLKNLIAIHPDILVKMK